MLPSVLLNWVAARAEQRNFRDPAGVRAQMNRAMHRRLLWLIPLIVMPLVAIITVVRMHIGEVNTNLILAAFMVVVFIFFLLTQHNRFQSGMLIWYALLTGGMVLTATGLVPPDSYSWFFIAAMAWLIFLIRKMPVRMDTSLFFRAQLGLLKMPTNVAIVLEPGLKLTKTDLKHFARYLGDGPRSPAARAGRSCMPS